MLAELRYHRNDLIHPIQAKLQAKQRAIATAIEKYVEKKGGNLYPTREDKEKMAVDLSVNYNQVSSGLVVVLQTQKFFTAGSTPHLRTNLLLLHLGLRYPPAAAPAISRFAPFAITPARVKAMSVRGNTTSFPIHQSRPTTFCKHEQTR